MTTLHCILIPHDKAQGTNWKDYLLDQCPEGYTIGATAEGAWYNPTNAKTYFEKMIPVYICGNQEKVDKMVVYFRETFQESLIMTWEVSQNVRFI